MVRQRRNYKNSKKIQKFLEDKSESSTKQQQRWSIGRANWTSFQKEAKITTKVRDQDIVEESYGCLVETIIGVAEKSIPKTSSETKGRPPVAWWKKSAKEKRK